MSGPFVVVGLGNPGPEYATHRHNAGFMVADLLAGRLGATFKRHGRAKAQVAEGWLGGPGGTKLVLVKPQSFMNLAGGPVSAVAAFYSVGVDRLVVVHDELVWQVPQASKVAKSSRGLWLSDGKSYASNIDCSQFDKGLIAPGLPALTTGKDDNEDPDSMFDPDRALEVGNNC